MTSLADAQTVPSGRQPFQSVWNKESLSVIVDMYRVLTYALNEIPIKWFATYGTLLGIVRNNQIIPWDGDIDIMVEDEVAMKEKAGAIAVNIGPHYRLMLCDTPDYKFWKCFDSRRPKIGEHCWSWPFIDIFSLANVCDVAEVTLEEGKLWWNPSRWKTLVLGDEHVSARVPDKADELLTMQYGPTWKTIQRDDGYNYETEQQDFKPVTRVWQPQM